MTLNISLDPSRKEPLFIQLAACVRAAIAAGHLLPGTKLPSSRALAAQFAIARGTVDAAYAVLAGECAIKTRRAAGTVVSGSISRRAEMPEQSLFLFPARPPAQSTSARPFQMGLPALDAFPRKQWSNLIVQVVRTLQPTDLADLNPAGLTELRKVVATYLGLPAAFDCTPEQVLITAGYQEGTYAGAKRPSSNC